MLIVFSRVGGGHLSAARALADELERMGDVSTRLVDVYLECGRFPLTLFPETYARLARNHPRLWSMVYRASDRHLEAKRVLRPFLSRGVRRVIEQERPDLVVSVLPAVNGVLAEAASRVGAGVEVVLTDWHAVHHSWVARGVQHYTAPTESARQDCIRFGAALDAIDVVGIPVRRNFALGTARELVRAERLAQLGLDPKRFTILAMVGAEGSPRAVRNIAHVARLDLDAQLLVICGRNEKLRAHLERLPARMPVRAVGFVDYVADAMRAADVLVTKAGGLTLAEAFSCDVPVVIHDVVPGQESGNLEYVVAQHAVEYAPSAQALGRVVTDLFSQPSRRASLAESGARLSRPDAATRIAHGFLQRLEQLKG